MLKGAFQFCLGSDHFQPVMVLSLEHAPLTSPYQRFLNVSTFYNELINCQSISTYCANFSTRSIVFCLPIKQIAFGSSGPCVSPVVTTRIGMNRFLPL
jgi:hypothetical protein